MKNRVYLSLVLVAALCVCGWTAYGQGQRSSPARQTWEYKVILQSRGYDQDWSAWAEDGKDLPKPVNSPAKRAELGSQGWELVAVATIEASVVTGAGGGLGYTSSLIQYFKRPR